MLKVFLISLSTCFKSKRQVSPWNFKHFKNSFYFIGAVVLFFLHTSYTHPKVHNFIDTQSHLKWVHHHRRWSLKNAVGCLFFFIPRKNIWHLDLIWLTTWCQSKFCGSQLRFFTKSGRNKPSFLQIAYCITSSPISPLTSHLLHNISCLSFLALFSSSLNPLLHHTIDNWSRQHVPWPLWVTYYK